jgi:meiotically up-regulated gene 157 (Mug157) protein
MRSHHADGRRKDLAFQIDQQLYPILELADFWRATGSLPPDIDWSQLVVVAWQAALAEVDATTGLAATTESAADDDAPLPFILSSQILLWYVAHRLAEMAEAGQIDLDPRAIVAVGERARQGVATHLAVDDGWAYATDGRGHAERYHDANDLPTAFAPLWGFCSAGHPAWLATMRFACSPANPGFFDGPFGGLGSLHTRGPWPLGDTQAWVAASLRGDVAAAAAALERLCDVALNDGMLPEAYDPTTGRILARHWFAWPGALLAALLILDGRGLLASHWYAAA